MNTTTKNALLALGSTPDEIANTLRDLGIKGSIDSCTIDASSDYPIVKYLVSMGAYMAHWYYESWDCRSLFRTFDSLFLSNKYPFLTP